MLVLEVGVCGDGTLSVDPVWRRESRGRDEVAGEGGPLSRPRMMLLRPILESPPPSKFCGRLRGKIFVRKLIVTRARSLAANNGRALP